MLKHSNRVFLICCNKYYVIYDPVVDNKLKYFNYFSHCYMNLFFENKSANYCSNRWRDILRVWGQVLYKIGVFTILPIRRIWSFVDVDTF